MRLVGTDKVLDENRFRRARAAEDIYTSREAAAQAVRRYIETKDHLPGTVRIVSGWFAPGESDGVRFSAPAGK